MKADSNNLQPLDPKNIQINQRGGSGFKTVHVNKWQRTDHGTIFRLTNKVAQVNFDDHTILTMNAHTKMLIFVDKFGFSSVYPIYVPTHEE